VTTELQARLTRVSTPDFDIVRVAHVELLVTDIERSAEFYGALLGLVETERTAGAVYLRGWEERLHHSLVLRAADEPSVGHVAFRVRDPADLGRIAAALEAEGCPRLWREAEDGHGRALRTRDPGGFPIEFFHDMDAVESQLRRYDLQRGAPIMRFDHVNFHEPDIERAIEFWLAFGFRCSEYISTDGADERLTGAWLLRKPTVHDVAFTAGRGPRLHHLAFVVAEPGAIIRACDQLAAAGHALSVERGPGRHGVSNAFFVYLRDPDGHRVELYACDYYTGDPDLTPLRWSVNDPRCRTFWGTRAPDSWYEESSVVLDLEGRPVPTRAPSVDERSQVMA
jgi:catechol 2,3-dioxygenase